MLVKKLYMTVALHKLVHSNLVNNQLIGDFTRAMFVVRARQNQSLVIFGKSMPKLKLAPTSFGEESNVPHFDYYGPKSHKMIKIMRYDLTKDDGSCFNLGRKSPI